MIISFFKYTISTRYIRVFVPTHGSCTLLKVLLYKYTQNFKQRKRSVAGSGLKPTQLRVIYIITIYNNNTNLKLMAMIDWIINIVFNSVIKYHICSVHQNHHSICHVLYIIWMLVFFPTDLYYRLVVIFHIAFILYR